MPSTPPSDRSRHPSTPPFPFGLTFLANENQDMRFLTKRGYEFGEVSSAMQKAIRRGDTRLAGYWALELWASGYGNYVWKRLLTVSAEDCWGDSDSGSKDAA